MTGARADSRRLRRYGTDNQRPSSTFLFSGTLVSRRWRFVPSRKGAGHESWITGAARRTRGRGVDRGPVARNRCPHAQIYGPEGIPTLADPGRPWARKCMRLYPHWEKGHLLVVGAIGDQPAWFIQSMLVLHSHIGFLEKQEAEHRKKKGGKG